MSSAPLREGCGQCAQARGDEQKAFAAFAKHYPGNLDELHFYTLVWERLRRKQ